MFYAVIVFFLSAADYFYDFIRETRYVKHTLIDFWFGKEQNKTIREEMEYAH